MSVDDWAQEQAKRLAEVSEPSVRNGVCLVCGGAVLNVGEHIDPERHEAGRVEQGIVHAFSALLSDEAVEAAARVLAGDFEPDAGELHETRLMLQAAIDAVTKEVSND